MVDSILVSPNIYRYIQHVCISPSQEKQINSDHLGFILLIDWNGLTDDTVNPIFTHHSRILKHTNPTHVRKYVEAVHKPMTQ